MNEDTPKPHDEDNAASKAEGFRPIIESPDWPIKRVPVYNSGTRATYSPPKEKGFRVVPRIIRDKFARRILRRRCRGVNHSRVMNKLDKTWLVKAACYRESDNGHAARRLFDAEIADHTEKRLAERTPRTRGSLDFLRTRTARRAYTRELAEARAAVKRGMASRTAAWHRAPSASCTLASC